MARASISNRSENLSADNFDGDFTVHTRIAGTVHFAHPARANQRQDFVGAEFVACREGHGDEAILS